MTFDEFYAAFWRKALCYVKSKGVSKADAEDLCSQAFLYCFQRYDQFDAKRASEESWLFLVIRSRLKNYWRDRHIHGDIDDFSEYLPDTACDVEKVILLEALRQQVAEALKKLNERQQCIVVLRYFKDMRTKEIADRLGITPGAVRIQLFRALAKIQAELKKSE